MNRFTRIMVQITKVVLVGSSVVLLGAACWKGLGTNTNVGVGNGNAEVNVNANASAKTNSSDEIGTSDWLTYTNDDYKFSVDVKTKWVLEIIESLTWESRITSGPAMAFQWKEGDQIKLNIFPDGGFDSGSLCTPTEQKSILIGEEKAKIHYCTDKTYVFFQDYPDKKNGTFRVVINASFDEERTSIDQIIASLRIF